MNRFGELLASTNAKPAMVVHLGAGSCKEHGLYKALNAERIIFVEPNKVLAAQAGKKFKAQSDVTVIDLAVAAERGTQFLNIISNQRFSSLLAPSELFDFYPNITVTNREKVETVTLEHICDDVDIDEGVDNLLVAELQGFEKDLFLSMAKSTLNKFKWIIIGSSEYKLYDPVSDSSQEDLIHKIQEAGYFVLVFKEDASPHSNILCIRIEEVNENALLEERERELSHSIDLLKQKLLETKTALAEQQNAHKKQLEDLEISFQSKSDELTLTIAQAQSINNEKDKLSQNVVTQAKKATDLAAEIADLKAEATLRVTEITELKAEATKRENEITVLKTEAIKLKDEITGLKNKTADEVNKLAEMQQTLRINNKLMLKSDADLSDLQNQYKTALHHKDQQHTLLCELKEKLGQAARFYRKLDLQSLVIDGDTLDQSDSDSEESFSNDDSED